MLLHSIVLVAIFNVPPSENGRFYRRSGRRFSTESRANIATYDYQIRFPHTMQLGLV